MPETLTWIPWLASACTKVAALEEKGALCLQGGDIEGYRDCMREKAFFLASLAEEGLIPSESLPPKERLKALERLRAFSQSAATALELNSIFYMSALLFPENHKQGQKNDLEIFFSKFTKEE